MKMKPGQIDKLRRAILRGVKQANSDYSRLSGGEWLSDRGVESFMAGRVAAKVCALRSIGIRRIVLEASVKEIEDYLPGGFTPGRRSRSIAPKNRIDIVAFDRKDSVVGIVELKRNLYVDAWQLDLKRIATWTKRGRDIQFGAFAAFVPEIRGDSAIKRYRNLTSEAAHKLAQKHSIRRREISTRASAWHSLGHNEPEWRYAVLGFVFTK